MNADVGTTRSRGTAILMPQAGDPSASGAARVASDTGVAYLEAKRLSPRSPRAALEPERVPEPKRPSRRARHPIVIAGSAIFTLILLVSLSAGLAFAIGKQRFEASGPLASDRTVNIPRGLGLREIADLLQREGVIDQPWVFIAGVLVLKAREDLKYGEYEFKKQASIQDVVDTIVDGKVIQHQVTIPEGLTSELVVARLMENDALSGNIKAIPKEGTLLPETYKFNRGTTREQVIQRMQLAQRRLLQEVWERRAPDLPLKTPDQLVVLASIVEKETGRPEERTRISAVFVNRLKQRMKLQSDPTIIYGLAGGKGTLGRPIMRPEIEQPTPYNTYVIEGLPPGAIANPGRASLEAAAGPARTKELYFVADGTGSHAFAETLDQHQRNVARLRQIEQRQRDGKDTQETQTLPPSASGVAPSTPPPPATAAGPSRASTRSMQSPQGQRPSGGARSQQ